MPCGLRLVIIHATGGTTPRDAVRTALGRTDLEWSSEGGRQVMDIGLTPRQAANFGKNHASMTSAGCWTHVLVYENNDSRSALIAAHVAQTGVVAGSTTPVNAVSGQVIRRQVFDCRAATDQSFISAFRVSNVKIQDCIFFEPQAASGVRADAYIDVNVEACVTFSETSGCEVTGSWFIGGRSRGHVNFIRNGGTVNDCFFCADGRMRGELLGFWPGDPQNHEESCLAYGIVYEGGRRPYLPRTNLRGNMGTRADLRLVEWAGGSSDVVIDYSLWVRTGSGSTVTVNRDSVDNISQGSWLERDWSLYRNGALAATSFRCISENHTTKRATIRAFDASGNPVTIAAGKIAWHCKTRRWIMSPCVIRNCGFYGVSGDVPRLSGVSVYFARDSWAENLYGEHVGDYVFGWEADCENCTARSIVCGPGVVGMSAELVFGCTNCHILDVYATGANTASFVTWGFPQLNCSIRGQGIVTNDQWTSTSMPTAPPSVEPRRSITNLLPGTVNNQTSVASSMVAVSDANLAGLMPATSP